MNQKFKVFEGRLWMHINMSWRSHKSPESHRDVTVRSHIKQWLSIYWPRAESGRLGGIQKELNYLSPRSFESRLERGPNRSKWGFRRTRKYTAKIFDRTSHGDCTLYSNSEFREIPTSLHTMLSSVTHTALSGHAGRSLRWPGFRLQNTELEI